MLSQRLFKPATFSTAKKISTLKHQVRHLNIHEFQAKQLMTKFNVAHQRGIVVEKVEQVEEAARQVQKEFSSKNLIIKAQILAGGRGKGTFDHGEKIGGVKFVKSVEDAAAAAAKMLGFRLTTVQTPKSGIEVKKVKTIL